MGKSYLSAKARHKYNSTFKEVDKKLGLLSQQNPIYDNGPFCTETSLHELEKDELSWIEFCSITKVRDFNIQKATGLQATITNIESILRRDGWQLASKPDLKPHSQLDFTRSIRMHNEKSQPHSRSCYMDYYYDANVRPAVFSIVESCDYYYRSIFNL